MTKGVGGGEQRQIERKLGGGGDDGRKIERGAEPDSNGNKQGLKWRECVIERMTVRHGGGDSNGESKSGGGARGRAREASDQI